jgi:hypothetical protein
VIVFINGVSQIQNVLEVLLIMNSTNCISEGYFLCILNFHFLSLFYISTAITLCFVSKKHNFYLFFNLLNLHMCDMQKYSVSYYFV